MILKSYQTSENDFDGLPGGSFEDVAHGRGEKGGFCKQARRN